ncbi:MAG TPA: polysaccharide biosynthesis protein, partial [Halanaerobiales bacterium]|nr:polysaccharide biosynthesis protein [Halanaerobiales bacterium]
MVDWLARIYKKERLIFIDVIALNLAMVLSFIIRFDVAWLNYFSYHYIIILTIISFAVLYFSNLYNKIWRYASVQELLSVFKITGIINVVLMVSFYLLTISFSRGVLAINFILDIFFLGGIRFGLRILREY